jgi:hypothetical protein
MSLLNQNSPDQVDDAARGESFTKGSSHVVWASIIACVAVCAAIALYMWTGQKPPAATGEIVQLWAHPQHTESSGSDANGVRMAKDSFDQVLVFARVRLHNQSENPLFLHQISIDATLPDGILSSYAAMPSEYDRLFVLYPNLSSLHGKPLSPDTTIKPGETLEGEIVSAFRLTKQQWDGRRGLSFTFGFQYQPNLVLTPKVQIVEQ